LAAPSRDVPLWRRHLADRRNFPKLACNAMNGHFESQMVAAQLF